MITDYIAKQLKNYTPWFKNRTLLGRTYLNASGCDRFGRHGERKKYLATKSLAKVANW